MDLRLLGFVLVTFLTACAGTPEKPPLAKAKPPVPELTTESPRKSAAASIRFRLPAQKSKAEFDVVQQKKNLFFVFEGWELSWGIYEVWALDKCGAVGSNSVLKAADADSRLMDFQTLHGFVSTEGSSNHFDLIEDSQRSLYKRQIALFWKQNAKTEKLDCGRLQAKVESESLLPRARQEQARSDEVMTF